MATTQAASLMILCQKVKVAIYVQEVRLIISKLLSLTKKDAYNASDEACEDENSKFVGTIGLTNDPATCHGSESWGPFSLKRTAITT